MRTNRLDWNIIQRAAWVATYTNGDQLVAGSKQELMRKINAYEKELN